MACSLKMMALIPVGGLLWAMPGSADNAAPSAAAHIQANAAAVAAMVDRNQDGRISEAEFFRHNAKQGRFQELDADGDGELNAEEQKAANVGPRIVR